MTIDAGVVILTVVLFVVCVCQAVRIHELTQRRDPWLALARKERRR